MDQYNNPRTAPGHPCLSPLYGIDTPEMMGDFNPLIFTSQPYIQRQLKEAAQRVGSTLASVTMVVHQLMMCNPTSPAATVSQARLAERAGMCLSTVRRVISGLRQIGVLHVIHNYRDTENGRRRTASTNILRPLVQWIVRKASKIKKQSLQVKKNSQLPLNKGEYLIDTKTGEILEGNPKIPYPRKQKSRWIL